MIQMGEWGACQPIGSNCLKFRAVLCLDSSFQVVESSNCEGIDGLATYADCEPSECDQAGGDGGDGGDGGGGGGGARPRSRARGAASQQRSSG